MNQYQNQKPQGMEKSGMIYRKKRVINTLSQVSPIIQGKAMGAENGQNVVMYPSAPSSPREQRIIAQHQGQFVGNSLANS